MDGFAANTEGKNSDALKHLANIPTALAYGLAAFALTVALLLLYYWKKTKQKRDLYDHIFDGNLKAKSISEQVKQPPRYMNLDANKILSKKPLPTFWIRNGYLICLYAAIICILLAITLFLGKPLGIM